MRVKRRTKGSDPGGRHHVICVTYQDAVSGRMFDADVPSNGHASTSRGVHHAQMQKAIPPLVNYVGESVSRSVVRDDDLERRCIDLADQSLKLLWNQIGGVERGDDDGAGDMRGVHVVHPSQSQGQ